MSTSSGSGLGEVVVEMEAIVVGCAFEGREGRDRAKW